jgi:hypothetical protein
MANDRLVRIYPVEIEFDPKDKFCRKVISEKHWEADKFGRFFESTLTLKLLLEVVAKTQVKIQNLMLSEKDNFIIYQYKGRPMIALNRSDGLFYTEASTIELLGKPSVEHQANIVLKMLKASGLSNAVIGKCFHSASARNVLGNLKSYK